MATPEKYLAATDPRMAALIKRSLRYNVKPGGLVRPFDALAESIAYQQLSGKAAATIWKRVRALYPRSKYLDPQRVLKTPDEKLFGFCLPLSEVNHCHIKALQHKHKPLAGRPQKIAIFGVLTGGKPSFWPTV